MKDQDRREGRRWSVEVPCLCGGEDLDIEGKVVELSFGGVRVSDLESIPSIGTNLNCTLLAEDSEATISARVIWVATDQQMVGLAFDEPEELVKKKLLSFVP